MKKTIALFLLLAPILIAHSQTKKLDSLAILIVDRMTDVIGDMESCSYKIEIARDVEDPQKGYIKHISNCHVFMSGPDKMLIRVFGEKGEKDIWYNGEHVAYYFKDEHNYGVIPAPSTTIAMIDSINQAYDIDFPAADFFYPTFTDDLLAHSEELRLLGRTVVDGKECFNIISTSKDMTIQLWINADEYGLPARFVFTNKTKPGNPQYQGVFTDWVVNPNLPSAMFDFEPPPGSSKLRIMPVNGK